MEKEEKNPIEGFTAAIADLVGLDIWGVAAGAGVGTMAIIRVGPRVRRTVPLRNPHLSSAMRDYDSLFSLHLRGGCAWRLETSGEVLFVRWSRFEPGTTKPVLERVVGSTIEDARLSLPGLDLLIVLGNGLRLNLFCDASVQDEDCNYSLFTPSKVYSVEAGSVLCVEEHTPVVPFHNTIRRGGTPD